MPDDAMPDAIVYVLVITVRSVYMVKWICVSLTVPSLVLHVPADRNIGRNTHEPSTQDSRGDSHVRLFDVPY